MTEKELRMQVVIVCVQRIRLTRETLGEDPEHFIVEYAKSRGVNIGLHIANGVFFMIQTQQTQALDDAVRSYESEFGTIDRELWLKTLQGNLDALLALEVN